MNILVPTDEEARHLVDAWNDLQHVPSYVERYAFSLASQAVCEACGKPFAIANGYYEAEVEPTYSYCKKCCHW